MGNNTFKIVHECYIGQYAYTHVSI